MHSLVYRVLLAEGQTAEGYVVFPKLADTRPALAELVLRPVHSSDVAAGRAGTAAEYETNLHVLSAREKPVQVKRFWVRDRANVRVAPSASAAVFVQLPPGTEVLAEPTANSWARVFKPTERVFESDRALGFVRASLLFDEPPKDRIADQ
jgi:hypothetical protein